MKLYLWSEVHRHMRVRTRQHTWMLLAHMLDTSATCPQPYTTFLNLGHLSHTSWTHVQDFSCTCSHYMFDMFIHFQLYIKYYFLVKNGHQNIAFCGTMIAKICFIIRSEMHSITLEI